VHPQEPQRFGRTNTQSEAFLQLVSNILISMTGALGLVAGKEAGSVRAAAEGVGLAGSGVAIVGAGSAAHATSSNNQK
jgi:hypothetical protein